MVLLPQAGYLEEADAEMLASKILPASPDEFVVAAFELFEDEGDFDEFLDTLRRICEQHRLKAQKAAQESDAELQTGATDAAFDGAFETCLEGLVEQGLLEPVEAAWILGRRAASDPTIASVYNAFEVRGRVDGVSAPFHSFPDIR